MRTAETDDLGPRPVERPGGLVAAHGAECVEDVGDGDDPRLDGNVVAREVLRIARAVPLLVVPQRNQLSYADEVGRAILEDISANTAVLAHLGEFFGGQ